MKHSHILLHFFVIITLLFVASANDGGYKILSLSYGDEFPAYPWQRVDHRETVQPVQRRSYKQPVFDNEPDTWRRNVHTKELPQNGSNGNVEKRKSNFEDNMAELNNFAEGSKVKVIYGRVPLPVILVSSYDTPKH